MRNSKTKMLALTGVLAALVILLGVTSIGLINLGFIYVTILCVPVIIGTLVLGFKQGMVLTVCFGLVSLFKALTAPSALVAPILGYSPLCVIALCILPRLVIPVVIHLVYKCCGRRRFGLPLCAVAGSLSNTVCYLGLLVLLYVLIELDASAVMGYIVGTALIAGSCEALVAGVVCTPIVLALQKLYKRED